MSLLQLWVHSPKVAVLREVTSGKQVTCKWTSWDSQVHKQFVFMAQNVCVNENNKQFMCIEYSWAFVITTGHKAFASSLASHIIRSVVRKAHCCYMHAHCCESKQFIIVAITLLVIIKRTCILINTISWSEQLWWVYGLYRIVFIWRKGCIVAGLTATVPRPDLQVFIISSFLRRSSQ